jgi:hypothetical protein
VISNLKINIHNTCDKSPCHLSVLFIVQQRLHLHSCRAHIFSPAELTSSFLQSSHLDSSELTSIFLQSSHLQSSGAISIVQQSPILQFVRTQILSSPEPVKTDLEDFVI